MGDRGHKTKIAKGHLTSDLFSFWGTKDTKLVLKRDKGHKEKWPRDRRTQNPIQSPLAS